MIRCWLQAILVAVLVLNYGCADPVCGTEEVSLLGGGTHAVGALATLSVTSRYPSRGPGLGSCDSRRSFAIAEISIADPSIFEVEAGAEESSAQRKLRAVGVGTTSVAVTARESDGQSHHFETTLEAKRATDFSVHARCNLSVRTQGPLLLPPGQETSLEVKLLDQEGGLVRSEDFFPIDLGAMTLVERTQTVSGHHRVEVEAPGEVTQTELTFQGGSGQAYPIEVYETEQIDALEVRKRDSLPFEVGSHRRFVVWWRVEDVPVCWLAGGDWTQHVSVETPQICDFLETSSQSDKMTSFYLRAHSAGTCRVRAQLNGSQAEGIGEFEAVETQSSQ